MIVRHKEHGQSLVEMAVILPLLLLVFLGLITVGFAMRRYHANLSYSREIARQAVREDGLNLRGTTVTEIGFDRLQDHFEEITRDDPFVDGERLTVDIVIVSTFVGEPCAIDPCLADCILSEAALYRDDDQTITPDDRPEYHYSFGAARDNHLDWQAKADEMIAHSTKQECFKQQRDGDAWSPVWDDAVIVEIRYDFQPLLVPGTIPLRGQTQMRFSR